MSLLAGLCRIIYIYIQLGISKGSGEKWRPHSGIFEATISKTKKVYKRRYYLLLENRLKTLKMLTQTAVLAYPSPNGIQVGNLQSINTGNCATNQTRSSRTDNGAGGYGCRGVSSLSLGEQ